MKCRAFEKNKGYFGGKHGSFKKLCGSRKKDTTLLRKCRAILMRYGAIEEKMTILVEKMAHFKNI